MYFKVFVPITESIEFTDICFRLQRIPKVCELLQEYLETAFFYELEDRIFYYWFDQRHYDKKSGDLKVWSKYKIYIKTILKNFYKLEWDHQDYEKISWIPDLEYFMVKSYMNLKKYSRIIHQPRFLYSLGNLGFKNRNKRDLRCNLNFIWNNGVVCLGGTPYQVSLSSKVLTFPKEGV